MIWEEYLVKIKGLKEVIKSEEYLKCSCPDKECEWHGKCSECVAVHRYQKTHVPECFKPILADKIKVIAAVAKLLTAPAEKPSEGYGGCNDCVCPDMDA